MSKPVANLDRRRALLLAAAIGAVLLALRPTKLFAPSANNHFAYLAQGWLAGRTSLQGPPPGYCTPQDRRQGTCKASTADDWARIDTLTLDDGETLRGFPCSGGPCRPTARSQVAYWQLGHGWRTLERSAIRTTVSTWYVSFPPGPAVFFVPFVAGFGVATSDVLLTVAAHALACALFFLTLRRLAVPSAGASWATLAWGLASPGCELAALGSVWFSAQIFGSLGVALVLFGGLGLRHPGLAGLGWALALSSRPINALGLVLLLTYETRACPTPWRALVRWAWLPGLALASMAWLNWLRFADIFEFGHRFLETRWQTRIQTHGLFSTTYLPRNLQCLLTLLPQVGETFPYLRFSIHGVALWAASPWLLVWRRSWAPRTTLLLATAFVVGTPSLFYQNSGQTQFSYRFAADWLLLVIAAQALNGAAASRAFRFLVGLAIVVHLGAAWTFEHRPGWLFRAAPMGWPFAQELSGG